MSLLLIIAAMAPATQSGQPPKFTARSEWRLCTRLSTLAQLKSRTPSLDAEPVVHKAFADCADQLKATAQTQSPEDIRQLQDEQRRLIQQDVEIFYWDNVTGHI